MERDFKGIWVPKEILSKGLNRIIEWILQEYGIDLTVENPVEKGQK